MKTLLTQIFTWWNGQTIGTRFHTWRFGKKVGQDELGNTYYEGGTTTVYRYTPSSMKKLASVSCGA